jgi:XTP/dITP diphosphohydrolase
MARQFTETKLVIASHNAGKVREIAELLSDKGVTVISAGDLNLPEPEETGTTFAANAKLKAIAAAEASGLPALADDSGLCVVGLDNAPGIYSARWAGPAKDFTMAMDTIRTKLDGNPDRSAFFVCALALAWPDGHCEIVEGKVHGALTFPPRGDKGFGYDPIFVANGDTRTFAEIDPDEKHAISHRANAFELLLAACF